jgi:hypothetical protein
MTDLEKHVVEHNEQYDHEKHDRAAPDLDAPEPDQHLQHRSELSSSYLDPEKGHGLRAARTVTQTTATTTSAAALESPITHPTGTKPWYDKLNPFKRGEASAVPAERTISREYGASLLSRLTFHWMAPIMKVQPTMFLGRSPELDVERANG